MFCAKKRSPPDQTTDFGVRSPVISFSSVRERSAAVLPSDGTSVVVVVVGGAFTAVDVVLPTVPLDVRRPVRSDDEPSPTVQDATMDAAANAAPATRTRDRLVIGRDSATAQPRRRVATDAT